MKVVQVLIHGDFVDAFAYRGRLLGIGRDKTLRIMSMDLMASFLEAHSPSSIPLPDLLFARNNWMSDPAYRLFCRNSEIAKAFKKCCDAFNEPVQLAMKDIELASYGLKDGWFNYVLDMNIYNGRLYIATDKGMMHCDFTDWQSTNLELRDEQKRHDGKTVHVSAKYGNVNISCASDGLLYAVDEFDVQNTGNIQKEFQELGFANKSYRSDFCNYDLINYIDPAAPQLCKTDHDPHQAFGLERETMLISGFADNLGFWQLPKKGKSFTAPTPEDITYVFNSDQTFYIHSDDGRFHIMKLSYVKKEPTLVSATPMTEIIDDSIIKTLAINYGFRIERNKAHRKTAVVVETFSDVRLISSEGTYMLSTEPALTVRSFPNSKQYRNLVVATLKEGLLVSAIYDDQFLIDVIDSAAAGNRIPRENRSVEDSQLE